MQVNLTGKDLAAFEEDIANAFLAKQIPFPVHLSGGNEHYLLSIFKEQVQPEDWVLSTWRSHHHCLLKGVPPALLKQAILDGLSISLCFPEYKILSSGICGGCAPIAVGLAMAIKRKGEAGQRKVVCFLGDMAFEMGIVHESVKYAANHHLPVLWVVEDNGKSVNSDTGKVWGDELPTEVIGANVIRYKYQLTRPHVGVGTWVDF